MHCARCFPATLCPPLIVYNEDCLWLSTVSVAMAGAHGARNKRPTLPLDSFFHFGCGIQPETVCSTEYITVIANNILYSVSSIVNKIVDNS